MLFANLIKSTEQNRESAYFYIPIKHKRADIDMSYPIKIRLDCLAVCSENHNFVIVKQWYVIIVLLSIVGLMACGDRADDGIDRLNSQAYSYRYRNLDSTLAIAQRAYQMAEEYDRGRGEALNNMAFVSIARMDYAKADSLLALVASTTSDDVERAVADVQMMRVCQRKSHNKDFYNYRWSASHHIAEAKHKASHLTAHEQARLEYARSEKAIVETAYYYYVGLEEQSREAIGDIDPSGALAKDTAQLLCYYYNMGSGGMISDSTPQAIAQREFDLLLRCYLLSRQMDFAYWEANAMQSLCEHLLDDNTRQHLAADNPKEIDFINTSNVPLDSLPADLARRSLETFSAYGDVYQTAGAYRTMAECLWKMTDYDGAINMLDRALSLDTAINQAPDLVSSIYERYSLTFSAMDEKPKSDYYRNLYLDIQEQTRQDRMLEARAEQLNSSTRQLNTVIMICIVAIVVMVFVLLWATLWRGRKQRKALRQQLDDTIEQTALVEQECLNNKYRNLEQRSKVALVGEITPLINRITHELDILTERNETEKLRHERMEYVAELAAKINEYNAVLTDWIQIRQGRLRLHIESFSVAALFDVIAKNAPEVERTGVTLSVSPTQCVVKADRTLTLFMLNTMIDNARRYTSAGDTITVAAKEQADCVELSVADTGQGMDSEKVAMLFNHNAMRSESDGHGFGLLNCKGIIEHYRKTSQLFSVCKIEAESKLGHGTTIRFCIPKGVRRTLMLLLILSASLTNSFSATNPLQSRIAAYADSTISCNVRGDYRASLSYADSCIFSLNRFYFNLHSNGTDVMAFSDVSPSNAAELKWWRNNEPMDFQSILIVRNEMAVAALALHDWTLYTYNNKVYTQLFREVSADKTLESYVDNLKKIEQRKNMAVGFLLTVLLIAFPLYYFVYYRRQKSAYRRAEERVNEQQERLHCAEMQRDKYYINNSVMDNCLSTLKHETMFYPSRLCALISDGAEDASQLRTIALYYKEIFWQLSQMAARQTIAERNIDPQMLDYMLTLFKQLGGDVNALEVQSAGDRYSVMKIPLPNMPYDSDMAARLFSPSTVDVRFIMLRQLVREIGETLVARGCGITATDESGRMVIMITLTRNIIDKIIQRK